jgi:hypothetical protein
LPTSPQAAAAPAQPGRSGCYDDSLRPYLENNFRWLAAIPIVVLAALQFGSMVQECATFDEGVHLSAGYRYWRTGKFNLNVEHPPLLKLLSAAPLLLLGPPLPADEKLLNDQTEFGRAFLYGGPIDADRLLLLGRVPVVLLTMLLAAAVAWAGRRYGGAAAGLIGVWLCALDPNLLAHGRYVTTDLISALFYFLTVIGWVEYLRAPSRGAAMRAAVALGLALSSKFSMVVLLPLLPVLTITDWLIVRRPWRGAVRALGVLLLVGAGAGVVVMASYGPESWRVLRGRPIGVGPETVAGVELPAHTYLTGFRTVWEHNQSGHSSYLLGKTSDTGWWYYFPVVFAVKSPLAALLLVIVWAILALRWQGDRTGSALAAALALAPAVYFGVALTSHINVGVRHLLPVYPFLYLGAGWAMARLFPARPAVLAALFAVLLQAGETLAVYPEFLGFFNVAAGGPKAGSRYLLDSNLDWGQDLKKLKQYMDGHPGVPFCLEYFGSADPGYYGIRYEYLPKTWDNDERGRVDCIGAISATVLRDVYMKPGSYAWLRERVAMGMVGSSMVLYDLRRAGKP